MVLDCHHVYSIIHGLVHVIQYEACTIKYNIYYIYLSALCCMNRTDEEISISANMAAADLCVLITCVT